MQFQDANLPEGTIVALAPAISQITFPVDDVQVNPQGPQKTKSYWEYLRSTVDQQIEAADRYTDQVVAGSGFHQLVEAIHIAYDCHYPLALSPDAFWLTIMQGLALHINEYPEELRSLFVSHAGKAKIIVRDDTLIRGAKENDWSRNFAVFSDEIRKYIGSTTHDWIVSDFSTTGPTEKAASEVVLMDAMKNYFDYGMTTCCGIPSITLNGCLADWEKLVTKAVWLHDTLQASAKPLTTWTATVLGICDELLNTAHGRVNQTFWRNIYKLGGGSGGPYMSGWVLKLFPYMLGYKRLGDKYVKSTRPNPALDPDFVGGMMSGLTHSELPSSMSQVPFEWHYYGEVFPYRFLAGITAVNQDQTTLEVSPRIGWAVAPTA